MSTKPPRGLPHTEKNYWSGCRCDDCCLIQRYEIREYMQRTKAARQARGLAPGDKRHGTQTGYTYHCCRCDICKRGMREIGMERRAKAKAASCS